MPIFNELIIVCWVIFLTFWLVSAIGVKKNIKGQSLWQSVGIRLGIVLVLVILGRTTVFGHIFQQTFRLYIQHYNNRTIVFSTFILDMVGVALAFGGVALAIWARMHLGRNWGMPMSRKEKPDLVTSGPYAYVRHPIYAGMLLTLVGSTCVYSLLWLIVIPIYAAYFLYSMRIEEKVMTKQFPDQYPAYAKRTKALIPFIW